jgi:hypothetical protein
LFSGSSGLYGSVGHIWSGCVRHVRGVYDSTRSFCRIYTRGAEDKVYLVDRLLKLKQKRSTNMFCGQLYATIVDVHQIGSLHPQEEKEMPSSQTDSAALVRLGNNYPICKFGALDNWVPVVYAVLCHPKILRFFRKHLWRGSPWLCKRHIASWIDNRKF